LSSVVEPLSVRGATSVHLRGLPRLTTDGVRVLDEDPDLAAELTGDRLLAARSRLIAPVTRHRAGAWPLSSPPEPARLGVLVLDGVLVREVLMEDTVSAELLGAGDLIRPWHVDRPARLMRSDVRWTVLEPVRIAWLGSGFAVAAAPFPEIGATLLDRVADRAQRLALTQAISQLNGVDRRVHSLLWHLAERWGRVARDGVVVPLALPHRIVASMVGARRPTVSTAIARLVSDGTVERRPDGTWLLRGEPVGLPTATTSRLVSLRRPTGAVVD